tara:strand:- start:365 stop:580 length:216 start_codon:yes stop_codon:yes gene_type:complete
MNEVYVLQIRHSGEEDEVFLFRQLQDARLKVYDYFGLESPKTITQHNLDSIEEAFFTSDFGYFSIYTTTIQ